QRTLPPRVDIRVDALELVAQSLRGHAITPQQLADIINLTRGHARQIHVNQRLLDALLAPPVTLDHGRLEHRALQFRYLQAHFPGLDGQITLVMAGPVVLFQCLFDRFGSVFPQCGLMVFLRFGSTW
ncbi:fimbrial isopeptide formation D2 domain-containing protein, partial [Bifidobacterium hapali]